MELVKKILIDDDIYFYDAYKNLLIKDGNYYQKNTEPLVVQNWISEKEYKWMLENCREQLVLGVTNECNMRCKYCTYHDNRYEKNIFNEMMDEVTAETAISEFLSCCKETAAPCISFYGGEPLLNFDLIKKCVPFALGKSNGRPVKFGITTNGLLLNDEVNDFFAKYNFEVGVSLDGPKFLHDRYRVTIHNVGTYTNVIENLKHFWKKHKLYFERNVFFSTVLAIPRCSKLLFDFFENSKISTVMTDVYITNHYKKLLN